MSKIKFQAGWIVTITGEPIRDGELIVSDGKISHLGKKGEFARIKVDEVVPAEKQIILPGLINAHVHLELTNLVIKKKTMKFADWIRRVVQYNRKVNDSEIEAAVEKGINLLQAAGCTTLGDISRGISYPVLVRSGLRGRVFLEVIAFDPELAREKLKFLKETIKKFPPDPLVLLGITPHSPWTSSSPLLKKSCCLARTKKLPFCLHISETKDEQDFIGKGRGDFSRLLKEYGNDLSGWKGRKKSPVAYLKEIGILENITGVHLNFVSREDLKILKRENASVVFCPGSNQWFGRKRKYPLAQFIKENINVALGTDSLASNYKLNIFTEMRKVKRLFPGMAREAILKMATINGAVALGLSKVTGSLEVGKYADMIALEPPQLSTDPYRDIFNRRSKLVWSRVGGRSVWAR